MIPSQKVYEQNLLHYVSYGENLQNISIDVKILTTK